MKNTAALKWLSEVAGKYKISVVLLVIIQMLYNAMTVSFALLLKKVIDCAQTRDMEGLRTFFVIMVALVIGQLFLGISSRLLDEYTKATLENAFKQRFFKKLLEKEYCEITKVHSGEWMNRLTSDTAVCANGIVGILPGAMGMLVKMTGALAALLALEPGFAYILIPGGIMLLLITYSFRKRMKQLHKQVQETDGRLRSFLQEHLGSILIVRAFTAEKQIVEQSRDKMQLHKDVRMKKNHFSNVCNAGFFGAMNGMYLLGIGYCAIGIMKGTISYGSFTAILQLIGQIQSPFAQITGILPRFYAMLASAERLLEVEQEKSTEMQYLKKYTIEEVQKFYQTDFETIVLEQADFSYGQNQEEQVFSKLQLELGKGQYIALTGQSGCGKSTLFKLLMCLYPLQGGERYLQKKDGTRQKLTPAWRKLFAYVPQENYLMSGTVREIITFAGERKDDEKKLQKALQIACAEDFVRTLEKGVDTKLGERGQGLSEGQMQRIAIARAIYADAPVLLLDEATSALDEATEQQVLKNLRKLTDKTVLIITHRPAALAFCDRQIVVER